MKKAEVAQGREMREFAEEPGWGTCPDRRGTGLHELDREAVSMFVHERPGPWRANGGHGAACMPEAIAGGRAR